MDFFLPESLPKTVRVPAGSGYRSFLVCESQNSENSANSSSRASALRKNTMSGNPTTLVTKSFRNLPIFVACFTPSHALGPAP